MEVFDRIGDTMAKADCENLLGDLCRFTGQLSAAERRYRSALELYETRGLGERIFPLLNLGLLLLDQSRHSEAREIFREGSAWIERMGRTGLRVYVLSAFLPCSAHDRDWTGFDHQLDTIDQLLTHTPVADVDIARPAYQAAELASKANQVGRARQAYQLALQQWLVLGNESEQASVQAKLLALPR